MTKFRSMAAYRIAASSLDHVALIPEVHHALITWVKSTTPANRGVLIGGLAMSFYAKPRSTEDVDLLFLDPSDIPESVPGFKRYRSGAFWENETQVDIEVTTHLSFKELLPAAVAHKVFDTAVEFDGLKVASREGMIALKLCSAQTARREHKDLADVVSLLDGHIGIPMDSWPLTRKAFLMLGELRLRLGESK